jgi:hypothetical protein
MMNDSHRPARVLPIKPEMLAGQLAKAAQLELAAFHDWLAMDPRHREMLWFIQAMSTEPGGLEAFARRLLATSQDLIGTQVMKALGVRRGQKLSLEQKQAVLKSLPDRFRTISQPGPAGHPTSLDGGSLF